MASEKYLADPSPTLGRAAHPGEPVRVLNNTWVPSHSSVYTSNYKRCTLATISERACASAQINANNCNSVGCIEELQKKEKVDVFKVVIMMRALSKG